MLRGVGSCRRGRGGSRSAIATISSVLSMNKLIAWVTEISKNLLYISVNTVLSRASANPLILTVLWFFKVLHVTVHHAKFLRGDSKVHSLSSHSCNHSDMFQAPIYTHYTPTIHPAARLVHTTSDEPAMRWQRDFELVRFLVGYSILYCRAGIVRLKRMKLGWSYDAVNSGHTKLILCFTDPAGSINMYT